MLEFRINDLITLKFEYGQTNIYLDNKLFRQCKFLLLEIPVDKVSSFDELGSIDEVAERLDKSMEKTSVGIPAEVKFWAHCSNLQVWVENNYNTVLLHSNLSFPLLRELCKLGDLIAKELFKEEVAKRMSSGYVPVVRYLLVEDYLESFDQIELEVIFQQLTGFLDSIEKRDLVYDEPIFEILVKLTRLDFLRAQKLLTKIIINTFNLGDLEQFLQLMSFEPFRYLKKEEVYWDFFSSATKYFFENLSQIVNMDFVMYLEENPEVTGSAYEEELSNIIFLSQIALNSLDKIPSDYYVRFIHNLASFPIESITNLLNLISEDNYDLDGVKGILNDNWGKFKNLFVKVKDKFIYVNRDKKSLVLKNLNISSISEIDNLERFGFLEILDLSNNNISTISNLNTLSRLRELNLSFNQIESIKYISSFLPSSKNFSLSSITHDNLEPFSNIEALNLSNNKISTIFNLDKLSRLRILNLSSNQIESIKDVGFLPNLEELRLESNEISQLEEFNYFSNLKILDLSENHISRINFSDFANLKNLRYLSLSNNDISSIKGFKHLKNLKNLEEVRVHNNLTSIPKKYKKIFS